MSMKRLMEAQVDEMLRHKWIESEKAGRDLGDACMLQWIREHAADFRHAYNLSHMSRLDDGTAVKAICIYPEPDSVRNILETFALPSGWTGTDCRFNMPASGNDYIVDLMGTSARIMVTLIGYGSDGIYAAGVVEGIPVACVARVAVPPGQAELSCDVDWVNSPMAVPVMGTFDTDPRQFT